MRSCALRRRKGSSSIPVYSGKTMSGLLDHVTTGAIDQGETVVMVHTGGVPALFAYHAPMAAHLAKRRRI